MSEKKKYSEEEIEQLSEQAAKNAVQHHKNGLNCAESVFLGFLDLNLTDFSPEIVAIASGFGGGMGATNHTCGAVTGGMMAIGTMQGRKNPYAQETYAAKKEELNRPVTGIYPRHKIFIKDYITEWRALDCRDLCLPFDETQKDAKIENCNEIIHFCAKAATRAALNHEGED